MNKRDEWTCRRFPSGRSLTFLPEIRCFVAVMRSLSLEITWVTSCADNVVPFFCRCQPNEAQLVEPEPWDLFSILHRLVKNLRGYRYVYLFSCDRDLFCSLLAAALLVASCCSSTLDTIAIVRPESSLLPAQLPHLCSPPLRSASASALPFRPRTLPISLIALLASLRSPFCEVWWPGVYCPSTPPTPICVIDTATDPRLDDQAYGPAASAAIAELLQAAAQPPLLPSLPPTRLLPAWLQAHVIGSGPSSGSVSACAKPAPASLPTQRVCSSPGCACGRPAALRVQTVHAWGALLMVLTHTTESCHDSSMSVRPVGACRVTCVETRATAPRVTRTTL